MRLFKSKMIFGLVAITALAGPVVAQEDSMVNVDLSKLSQDFAGSLDVGVGRVPSTVSVSSDIAATACGVDASSLSDGSTCMAITTTPELTSVVEDEIGSSNNSARAFAPGQQEEPAKESAPGQLQQPATESAPGHLKTDDTAGATGGEHGSEHSGKGGK